MWYLFDNSIFVYFQVTIDSANSINKQEITTIDTPTSLLQRELENTRNLTVTTSSYNEPHTQSNNTVPEHHVTITSSKHNNSDTNDKTLEEFHNQGGVIQTTNSSQPASVLVAPQCQSAIVVNPQSVNSESAPNSTEETKPKDNNTPSFNTLWWRDGMALDKANLILMGFSKGCVVLNQLIYEFHYLKTLTPDDSTMMRLVSRISEMYWLDGGHAGGKNTWITSRSLLETLTRLGKQSI